VEYNISERIDKLINRYSDLYKESKFEFFRDRINLLKNLKKEIQKNNNVY
jgi:hypothetical protein